MAQKVQTVPVCDGHPDEELPEEHETRLIEVGGKTRELDLCDPLATEYDQAARDRDAAIKAAEAVRDAAIKAAEAACDRAKTTAESVFTAFVAPLADGAREVTPKRPRRRGAHRTAQSRTLAPQIRQWAKERGHKVNERGRIPANIVAEYEAAH